MVLGIGFIATITAAVSTYFLSNFGDKETTLDDIVKKLDNIEKELEKIKDNKK
jgi:C4-dicarboxylate transporter